MISGTKHHMVLCEAINMLLFQTHFYWHFPSVNRCSWLLLCLWAQKTWASTFVHLQEAKATCQWECSLCFREYQLYFHSVCRTAEQACITVSTCGSFLSSWFCLTSSCPPAGLISAQRLLPCGSFAVTSQCQEPQNLPGRTEQVFAAACSPVWVSRAEEKEAAKVSSQEKGFALGEKLRNQSGSVNTTYKTWNHLA